MWDILTLPIVPILTTGVMTFGPVIDPRNTRLLVSQTRLDRPRTRFCFGSCCRGKWLRKPISSTRQKPDKTTHLTNRRWFSFSLSNNQIAFPKCVGFSKIKMSTQFQLGRLCWSFIDFGVDGFFLLLQSCLQKQLKAILFLNYAKPPG